MSEFVIKRDDGTFFKEDRDGGHTWSDLRWCGRFSDYRRACRCVWERLDGSAGEVRILRVKFVGKVRYESVGFANGYPEPGTWGDICETIEASAKMEGQKSTGPVELFRKVRA